MTAEIGRLREMGYALFLDGDTICCQWQGGGQPNPEQARPLLESLRQHKAEAIGLLEEEQDQQDRPRVADSAPDHQTPAPIRDPCDERNYPPPSLIITLADREHPEWWIARRTGTLEPVGRGLDQVEAILDLERLEQQRREP